MFRFTRSRGRELPSGEIEFRIRIAAADASAFLTAFPRQRSAHYLEPNPGPRVEMRLVPDLEEHEEVIQFDVHLPDGEKPPTQTIAPAGTDTAQVNAPAGLAENEIAVWERIMRMCGMREYQHALGVEGEPLLNAFEGPTQVAVRIARRRMETAEDPHRELAALALLVPGCFPDAATNGA